MNTSQAQRDDTAREPLPDEARLTTRLPRVLAVKQQYAESENGHLDPARIRRIFDAGGYTRLREPAVIVYRLRTGQHEQAGIVIEVSIDDYRSGRIRRHEATDPRRERQVEESIATTGFEQAPVMLAHPARSRLRALIAEVAARDPEVHLASVNGTAHTLWVAHQAGLAQAVQEEVGRIATLYITDGHHRMVAAERQVSRRGHIGGNGSGAFALGALFPSDEMHILGCHRCFSLSEGTTTANVLDRLSALPVIARVDRCGRDASQPVPGVIAVRIDGQHYRLWLRAEPRDLRTSLDTVLLDEELLPPLSDCLEPARRDGNTPSSCGTSSVRTPCAEEGAICFLPQPPSIDQIMAVADAGLVLPPKSTWFDPKAMNGLLVREM